MPYNYMVDEVSPFDLQLDTQNPRFIVPLNPIQQDIRLHLLTFEDVHSLAQDIVNYGGLMPGDRAIVCEEEGKLVILEGNRRVCACQLLLKPELIPNSFKSFPKAPSEVKKAIEKIPIDIVKSRDEAASVLSTRHIEGIRKWSTIGKMRFYVSRYEKGQSISSIAAITETTPSKVKKGIFDFYLLKAALELPYWSKEQKEKLDWHKVEPIKFLRIFDTDQGRKKLGLSFNFNTGQIETTLPTEVFTEALILITEATLLAGKANTRSRFNSIPGLPDLLKGKKEEKETDSIKPEEKQKPKPDQEVTKEGSKRETGSDNHKEEDAKPTNEDKPKSSPKPAIFFEGLTWTSLKTNNTDARGIIVIASEIKNFSKNYLLNNFPNAGAMLLRSITEQSLKYYLKTNFPSEYKLKFSASDPQFKDLISYYKSQVGKIFPDKNHQRIFNAIFGNPAIKDSLDLIVHQTNITSASAEILTNLANSGLFAFIQILLN